MSAGRGAAGWRPRGASGGGGRALPGGAGLPRVLAAGGEVEREGTGREERRPTVDRVRPSRGRAAAAAATNAGGAMGSATTAGAGGGVTADRARWDSWWDGGTGMVARRPRRGAERPAGEGTPRSPPPSTTSAAAAPVGGGPT